MTSADTRSEGVFKHPDSASPYLTAAEAAVVLRVGPYAVLELCNSGQLLASKPGKMWLIARADLTDYIEAHSNRGRGVA